MTSRNSRRNQERVLFLLMGLIIVGLVISGYFLFVRKVLPELNVHKQENPLSTSQNVESAMEQSEGETEFIPESEAANIKLYFGLKGQDLLAVEVHKVRRLTMLTAQAKQILEHILMGPKQKENYRIIPDNVSLRGLFFDSGTFIVDLSEEFNKITQLGAIEEGLAIYSIVNALTELDSRARVKFLINGTESQANAAHIDLSATLSRVANLIQP